MKVDLSLALKDVPGMLVKALQPISDHGGNILSVLHSRGGGRVEVNIVFKVRDESMLEEILKGLGKEKIPVVSAEVEGRRYYKKQSLSFILIGHVIDKDIQDTIDQVNEIGNVSDVDVRMPDPEEKSSVLLSVDVDEKKMASLLRRVDEVLRQSWRRAPRLGRAASPSRLWRSARRRALL
ncbi:MAG: ACT domain-containing protein [Candidatus Altiarchaeota archaeon]|nr:ACT domain-containing protein [Candidatus Altiarchaeota archaeon]